MNKVGPNAIKPPQDKPPHANEESDAQETIASSKSNPSQQSSQGKVKKKMVIEAKLRKGLGNMLLPETERSSIRII